LTALLVKPPFPSGTGAAFARLEKRRESAPAPAGPQGALLKKSLTAPPAAWPFYNDFLPLFLETPGEGEYYREILRSLKELGADFAGLSGSGSGCFGIFTDEGTARKAEEVLSRSPALVQLVRRAALVA
jgi:4-diphosphocytidyl-2-C-methyl-D-erythritol kinase